MVCDLYTPITTRTEAGSLARPPGSVRCMPGIAHHLGVYRFAARGRGRPGRRPNVRGALGVWRPVRYRVSARQVRSCRDPRARHGVGRGDHRRGVTAWQDLALHVIARLCGREHAIRTAKVHLLAGTRRTAPVRGDGPADRCRRCCHRPCPGLDRRRLRDDNPVAAMVERSALLPRTFGRRFRAATGRGQWNTSTRSGSKRRGGSSSRARSRWTTSGSASATRTRRSSPPVQAQDRADAGRVSPQVRDDRALRGASGVGSRRRLSAGLRRRGCRLCPASMHSVSGARSRSLDTRRRPVRIERRETKSVEARISANRDEPQPRDDGRRRVGGDTGAAGTDPGLRHAHARHGERLRRGAASVATYTVTGNLTVARTSTSGHPTTRPRPARSRATAPRCSPAASTASVAGTSGRRTPSPTRSSTASRPMVDAITRSSAAIAHSRACRACSRCTTCRRLRAVQGSPLLLIAGGNPGSRPAPRRVRALAGLHGARWPVRLARARSAGRPGTMLTNVVARPCAGDVRSTRSTQGTGTHGPQRGHGRHHSGCGRWRVRSGVRRAHGPRSGANS